VAIFIGTSGWSYDHWVDIVYPRKASSLERLDAYAARFDTVEVNNTFYRWPEADVFTTWRKRTPAGFIVGGSYRKAELGRWADHIREWASQGKDV
jgi:uncharacterized protein YecE (DUF72 family)